MPLTPGTCLGSYEVLSPLGAGGMGEVYRAHDKRLGRDVAIKILPDGLAASPDRLARFEREARTIAGLNHPNIVVLHSIEEQDGVRFLTMELVEGRDLSTLIAPAGLPLGKVLDIAIPLADAMIAAHEKRVVHRDLKPANVMLTRDGRVKVLDFGLAKLMEIGSDLEMTRTTNVAAPLTDIGEATRRSRTRRCHSWSRNTRPAAPARLPKCMRLEVSRTRRSSGSIGLTSKGTAGWRMRARIRTFAISMATRAGNHS